MKEITQHKHFWKGLNGWQTFADTSGLHGTVPLSILTDQVVVVPSDSKAFITDKLNHSAMGKHLTRRWVADVASVLRFGGGWTNWQVERKGITL